MSNLSNLMISGSYLGLINLQDSTQNLASQSGYVELQDGLGDNIGISIDASNNNVRVNNTLDVGLTLGVTGSSHFRNNVDIDGDLDVSGSFVHSGSIDVVGDVTIEGDITAHTGSFDTINTRVLNVTIETASVIFSSGSNVLGDEITDRQDLIGQVVVSGSLGVEGNSAFTGSLTVSNEISSSTVNGIGNVTAYSSSVDDRLTQLEVSSGSQDSQLSNLENFTASQENINSGYNTFTSSYYTDSASFDNRIDQLEADTGSQDSRLDSLEAFTGSQETLNGFYNQHTSSLNAFSASQLNINSGYNSFTQSTDTEQTQQNNRLTSLEGFTASLQTDFVSTGSFNAYTASVEAEQLVQDGRLNNLELETSSIDTRFNTIEAETASLQTEIDGLSNKTGSYATTGSNTFDGTQTISGSVYGDVTNITIASNTASMDLSTGNFFTVALPAGTTHLTATNIQPGQTTSLRLGIGGGGRNIEIDTSTIKFASGQDYEPSVSQSYDLVSFISFDSNSILAVSQTTFDQ